MIDKELLDIIACPETKQDLVLAEPELIERINLLIEKGELMNRSKAEGIRKDRRRANTKRRAVNTFIR